MPLYSYVCIKCGHRFEELTSIQGKDKILCPKCSGAVKRSYEGSCSFGGKSSGCSGKCSNCSGCGRH